MGILSEKLAILEHRLQTLIEEGTARILPIDGPQVDIGEKLINAMQSSVQKDMIAPDLFILIVHPDLAQVFDENQSIMDEMSELVQQSGTDSNLCFRKRPRIKIRSDSSLDSGTIRVISYSSQLEVNETEGITLDNDGENQVPNNAFLIIDGVKILPLTHPVVNIGRRADNHVVIDDVRVSRLHAQVRATKGHYQIFDLDSTGGTFVNGVRLAQTTLYPGDVISLAGVDLVYSQDIENTSGNDRDATQPLMPFPQG